MEVIRALRMRIYPDDVQQARIDSTIDSCRFVYNHMLARNRKVYDRRGEHLSYNKMQNLLPAMKNYLPWLKEADSQALKHACRQVSTAYDGFFKHKTRFPKFHSRRIARQSYTTTNKETIDYRPSGKRVKLPFLGWMSCSDSRVLKNHAFKYATVSRQNGKYYVSITYSIEKNIVPVSVSESQTLGLDYKPYRYEGRYTGRVMTRASGSFDIRTINGELVTASYRFIKKVQNADGYQYSQSRTTWNENQLSKQSACLSAIE